MKTVYELWHKPAGIHRYERYSSVPYPDLDTAMAAAGYPDPAEWQWANSDQVNMIPADAARNDGTDWVLAPTKQAENDADRIELATDLALEFGQTDGDHHKAWVIDQMVRVLLGDKYERVIADYCDGEDGPETYSWDEGIAP